MSLYYLDYNYIKLSRHKTKLSEESAEKTKREDKKAKNYENFSKSINHDINERKRIGRCLSTSWLIWRFWYFSIYILFEKSYFFSILIRNKIRFNIQIRAVIREETRSVALSLKTLQILRHTFARKLKVSLQKKFIGKIFLTV